MVLVLFAADSNAQIEDQGLFDVGSLEALVLSVLFLDSLVVLDPMVFDLAADYSAVEVLNLWCFENVVPIDFADLVDFDNFVRFQQ